MAVSSVLTTNMSINTVPTTIIDGIDIGITIAIIVNIAISIDIASTIIVTATTVTGEGETIFEVVVVNIYVVIFFAI